MASIDRANRFAGIRGPASRRETGSWREILGRQDFRIALAGLVIGGLWAASMTPGSWPYVFSGRMAKHIVSMNLMAPLAALALLRNLRLSPISGKAILLASALQIVLLWLAHAPAIMRAVMSSPVLTGILSLSLFVSATVFWCHALGNRGTQQWHGIASLLVTSKLFCLLAVVLVFAPRPLYAAICYGGATGAAALADQQTAGMLMLAACPATYVLAGIWLSARWLKSLGIKSRQDTGASSVSRAKR